MKKNLHYSAIFCSTLLSSAFVSCSSPQQTIIKQSPSLWKTVIGQICAQVAVAVIVKLFFPQETDFIHQEKFQRQELEELAKEKIKLNAHLKKFSADDQKIATLKKLEECEAVIRELTRRRREILFSPLSSQYVNELVKLSRS